MPTYVYKCKDCGHRFEEAHGFHDDPVQVCPDCGGQVQRVIGNVGVTFKGSGFYRTDSRTTKPGSAPAKAADKPASDTAKPAATKDAPATPTKKKTDGSSTTT